MTTEPIDVAVSEQNEALHRLKREFRTKLLMISALTLSGTVCAAGALTLMTSDGLNFMESLVITGFLGMLVFAALADHFRKKHQILAQGIPEIYPPDTDEAKLNAWKTADDAYEKLSKNQRGIRILILFIGLVCSSIFPLAFPISLIFMLYVWSRQSSVLSEQPHSPLTAVRAALNGISNLLQWIWFGFWILCLGLMLFFQMYASAAHSKVESLNSAAKQLSTAVVYYQTELIEADQDPHFSTTIVSPGEIGAEGSLTYGVYQYFSDSERYWYAVVFDADGNVTDTYISRSELTADDLHPQDMDAQIEQMKSPFHEKEVIGYYHNTSTGSEVNTNG